MSKQSWIPCMVVIEKVSPPMADISGLPRFAESHFGLPHMSLERRFRGGSKYTDAKHMVRYYLRKWHPKLSLNDIGRMTCRGDHSTVVSSILRHPELAGMYPEYRRRYEEFENACLMAAYHTP